MTDCPDISPELIAYADQRIASCAAFLARITASEASLMGSGGSDDSLGVCALSAALDRILTHRSALSDVAALAIRRLAAAAAEIDQLEESLVYSGLSLHLGPYGEWGCETLECLFAELGIQPGDDFPAAVESVRKWATQ